LPKLALNAKEIKKFSIIKKHKNIVNTIPENNPALYDLLKDNRHEEEKFSRVCLYSVNHYYLIGTEWLCEKIFYPSQYGLEQIEENKFPGLIAMHDKLINEGIGLWGERPVPNIKKPVKRLALECKPSRMLLECKG